MQKQINNEIINREVKNHGWIKIEKLIDGQLICDLDKNFEAIYEACRNLNYENVSEIKQDDFVNYPEIRSIISYLTENIDIINQNNLMLDKIWMVISRFENIKENELPFIPHIDKRRTLKIMIYMER